MHDELLRQQEICNEVIKYPTAPQTRGYTTLWNVAFSCLSNENYFKNK